MKTFNTITRVIFILLGFILSKQALSQTQNIPHGSGPTISNILGGAQIPIEDAPYQVSMKVNGNHICGGSIIADRWILTAAHCIVSGGATAANTTIHAGSTNQTSSGTGQTIQAQTLFTHPNYDGGTLENDIALIYLSQPLQFNHAVVPIEYANTCNTTSLDIDPGNDAFLTGWGITCNSCPGATNLQGVTMPLISQANAMAINQAYNSNYTLNVSGNMLPLYNIGSGAGPGDSGGPAVIENNGYQINIGASSWGYWPKDQLPTVYANVRNYTTWIESVTGLVINSSGIDLYTKDKPWDMGFEPFAYNFPWTSEDIWVRNQNDGMEEHQNPEYYQQPGNSNYVYVRVRNKGCLPTLGNETLNLYWAKAATALSWPNHWNGTMSVAGNSLGDIVGSVTLPIIEPGKAYVAVFPWQAPNPADFVGLASDPIFFADEPHHFCLLSRIEAGSDPMAVTETANLAGNVLNNNNIAWKNISVVDLDPSNFAGDKVDTGASILVGNAWEVEDKYTIEFMNPEYFTGNPITKEAEITITLDKKLWSYWQMGGFNCTDIKIIDESARKLLITGDRARLECIAFPANERYLLHVAFNFLTREISDKNEFTYHVIQRRCDDNSVQGGEEFTVYKRQGTRFLANAGSDQEIEIHNSTTLSAYPIDEQAIYNWYDEADKLVYEGRDYTLSPQITSKYKLEVIARSDGFKDYDEVEVKVKKFFIKTISPNPSSNFINIEYLAADARSAYVMISPLYSGTSNQFILNTSETERIIDISNLPSGQYAVVMVCDGTIADFRNILIQ
jgi:hypothetical protein